MVSKYLSSMTNKANVAAEKPVDGFVIINYPSFYS